MKCQLTEVMPPGSQPYWTSFSKRFWTCHVPSWYWAPPFAIPPVLNALSFPLYFTSAHESLPEENLPPFLDQTETPYKTFSFSTMHSSSSQHWSQLRFGINMITWLMSFSLTQPYSLQYSTFVFAHHCIHILGRELMLNKYLSNIPKGCAKEDKRGRWVSLEEEMSGCSNKLVILRALHHTFEKRSWELGIEVTFWWWKSRHGMRPPTGRTS